MSIKVMGLIKVIDALAFEEYRSQVSQTIKLYEGKILTRGVRSETFWNQLNCEEFDDFVEIEFKSQAAAHNWANSPEYKALLQVRTKAMKLTLFSVVT
jgi:uncharacterized protein (DUF1330 family)